MCGKIRKIAVAFRCINIGRGADNKEQIKTLKKYDEHEDVGGMRTDAAATDRQGAELLREWYEGRGAGCESLLPDAERGGAHDYGAALRAQV